MFFIYKITNLLNQKNYIGSSTINRGMQTRWEEHIKAANSKNHPAYNYPLQRAIRKYGAKNFSYEILKDNILTIQERAEQEKYYINKYNALTNSGWGYNQTLFTECALADPAIKSQIIEKTSKKVALVDKEENIIQIFNSVHEASRFVNPKNGDKSASLITKICNGETRSIHNYVFRWINGNNEVVIPDFKTRPRRTPIAAIYKYDFTQILYFDSILQASQLLDLDRASIQHCISGQKRYSTVGDYIFRLVDNNNNIIENNILLDELKEKYITLENGETHTIKEWCEILSISTQCVYQRMKKYSNSKTQALNYYLHKKGGML